jgi:hypothetical protein
MASCHTSDAYCTQFGNFDANQFMEPIHDNSTTFFLSFCFIFSLLIFVYFITIERPWNTNLHPKKDLSLLYFMEFFGGFNTLKIQRFFHFNENNTNHKNET